MKILITSIVDPMNSAYSRIHAIADFLSRDHKVTILSVRDKWKESQKSSVAHKSEFAKMLSKIRVIYLTDEERSIAFQEIFSRKLVKRRFNRMDNKDFDLILDYNTISLGYQVSKSMKGVPRIYDLADDLTDMIRISTQLPAPLNSIASFVANGRILKSLARADLATATCNELLDQFRVSNEKRRVIPNGVPTTFLSPISKDEKIDKRNDKSEFLIGYVGVLREWLDFGTVLRAMKKLSMRTPIRLMIIGEEGDGGKILEDARNLGLEKQISMIGTVPHEEIGKYLVACDCGIIPFKPMKTTELAMPLKLFEYFSSGIPVISTPIRPIKRHFENEVFFYIGERGLIDAINLLIESPELGQSKVVIARDKISRKFTWEKIGEEYEAVIRSLSKS